MLLLGFSRKILYIPFKLVLFNLYMKMSKYQIQDLESLELRIKNIEKSLQEILRELKSLNARLERLESLPHNRPKDILVY